MTYCSASQKSDLAFLNSRASHLKEGLKQSSGSPQSTRLLKGMAEAIARQLRLEEQTMEKVGLALTPIHMDEHRKMLEAISLLEFSWKAQRISDEVYSKALNYKFEFHHHYFDEAQLLLILEDNCDPE
ncbi:MAG: hypothetical protein U9Q61_06510 [Thermodesulfobacteriota bacterium]|nr:hypothetical protein [Thermodesulfobacteriota bacterium]